MRHEKYVDAAGQLTQLQQREQTWVLVHIEQASRILYHQWSGHEQRLLIKWDTG
jgi:hypothetical protein